MSITIQSNEPAKAQEAKAPKADEVVKQSASTENQEVQESQEQTDETLDASDASDETEETTDEDKSKAPFKNVQKRIDKLTKRAHEERREKEYWREQALKSQTQAPPKQEERPAPVKDVEGRPTPEDFESHADYVEALADWKVEQKLAAREAKNKQSDLQTEFQSRRDKFAKEYQEIAKTEPDFNDVVEAVEDVIVSEAVQAVLYDSEQGARLAYELAKDPEGFKRINKLAPLAAAREIGKIEARLARDEVSETKDTKEIKTTKAPKPISPLGAKNTGSTKKTIHDPNLSQAEYERLRREQMAQQG